MIHPLSDPPACHWLGWSHLLDRGGGDRAGQDGGGPLVQQRLQPVGCVPDKRRNAGNVSDASKEMMPLCQIYLHAHLFRCSSAFSPWVVCETRPKR